MAHSSRSWSGARTPQALKRVRQSTRRHAVLQPRRSAARTHVKNALQTATEGDVDATREALAAAASAIDRAAKVGAIHPNAAARRKSRLMLRVNAAMGGTSLDQVIKPQRQVGKAAAAKAAKARIAAGKATKAKGEQTAAGKARAALSKSTRASESTPASEAKSKSARSGGAKSSATKSSASKSSATKSSASKSGGTTATKSRSRKSETPTEE